MSGASAATSSKNSRTLAIRWFEEIWNQQRDETFFELCAPDFESEKQGTEDVITRENFLDYRDALLNAISEFHLELEDVIAEGPRVSIRWALSGRHTGPGLGVPPSGHRVSFRGMSWMEFQNGQVVRGGDHWNRGQIIESLLAPQVPKLQEEFGLTVRESEVALLMAERQSYKEIAQDLDIRPSTVRRHAERILNKLGIHGKGQVAEALGVQPFVGVPPHGSDLAGAES